MPEKYEPGQKVNIVVLRETDLGFVAKVNDLEEGLLYHNELFEQLEPGDSRFAYVKKVRPDGRIDLLLQAFGNLGAEELGQEILEAIKFHKGFLALNEKSPAEKIYELFGVSKKKFKIAIGGLYKKRLIKITEAGMELVTNQSGTQISAPAKPKSDT